MQTSVQMDCIPNADTIDTPMESDAQPSQNETSQQEEDNNLSVVDHDDTLVIAFEEAEEQATETPGDATQKVESKQSEKPSEPKLYSDSNSVAHNNDLNAQDVQPKTKKQDKVVRDGRKYVPSKKAMTDPLKIDMSKPLDMLLTSSQISLQCMECHIIFSDLKSKERHLKSSHPAEYEQSILRNALFACYVCDRHFTNSAELMAHQKTHPEKKPFKCPICSQTFSKSSELTVHKKVHFGRDGYTCTDCGKSCKTLTLLKYHRRTHTGERPYVCKECGKRFTMPKALQKHMDYHLPEGAGSPLVIYTCFICKGTFKSTKTRNHHMQTKHNVSKTTLTKTSAQQVKQCTPIITPISISQPSLLQVGPNGPLQKVDANIDTEQIRKLIESLGNVQKVNQVVILGQVPPDAPPLEVQQLSDLAQPLTLNINPTQFDFMGLNSNTNETTEDPMEQTIILEPITPDGQLLNPPFSALESNIGDNPVAEVMVQQPTGTGTDLQQTHEMVCHNNVMRQNLEPNLDQTFVLELTPALTPTAELEQSENVLQVELPSSTSEQIVELERPLLETSLSEQNTSMSVQSLMSTVELEMMPIQTDTQIIPACTFIPQETVSECQMETVTQDEPDSLMQTKNIDQVQMVTDIADEIEEGTDKATSEQVITTEPEPTTITEEEENDNNHIEENTDNTQMEEKQVPQTSELPINVMSAQELVKVRKRKPPKAFFFQGYMQEFVSSIYDDFQNNSRAAKRKKTKKSHLVVKFGPPTKEKKSKKASKTSKQPTQEDLKDKSPTQRKIQKKGRKDKKVVNSDCTAEIEVPASSEDQDLKQKQKHTSKKKKQKVGAKKNEKHMNIASSVFKKKPKKIIQQSQSENVKEKTITNIKQKKVLDKEKEKSSPQAKEKSSPQAKEKLSPQAKADSASESHVIQDSLLLLKGHKQPQLKVHKLDPLKASGKTQEVFMSDSQTSPKGKESSVSPVSIDLSSENKKQGGRAKKALTLLSSLHTSKKQDEAMPPKPKPIRKRKATSNVETEGVITSKKALECKDCGQRFSDVSLLQNHKATVHIVESPGITYTNGNLFEGVTRIDLYQLPNQDDKGIRNSGTGWDTEPGLGDVDREHCVSFPVLNTSPSLPVPPSEDYCTYDDKGGKDSSDDGLSTNPPRVLTPSPQTQVVDKDNKSRTDTEVQATTDEDIKEDLVLEVDLVTVGEHSEKDDLSPSQDEPSQNKENEPANSESGISDQAVKKTDLTLHTVSCSTHQVEIKEEEEEMVIQKKQDGIGVSSTESEGEKQGAGHLKKGEVLVEEPFSEENSKQNDCDVQYERNAISNNNQVDIHHNQDTSEISAEKVPAPASVLSSREGLKEQAVAAQELATSRTETETNEPSHQAEEDHERDSSPGIILEKVLTSAHLMSSNNEKSPTQLLEPENQEIKVEESIDSTQVCTTYVQPPHHDITTVLVKEESRLLTNDEQTPDRGGRIRWNVEQNTSENSSSPLNEAMESTDSSIAQTFNSSQCIFYPVKEEEREVLVGEAESCRPVSSGVSSVTHQPEHHTAAGAETEWQATPNLSDFLLQSSDEEDCTYEMSDSHVDSEAEIMANFYKKRSTLTNQSDVGLTASSTLVQEKGGDNTNKQPIDYFSEYFNRDMWREISHCTNKLTNMSNPISAAEVAQFVGIHIAMGTLKYPSPRLYWEDLTKVPLVADTMPWSRFLDVSRMLKLACPQDNQLDTDTRREGINNYSAVCNTRRHEHFQYSKTVNTDPLWKIQPILQHFVRGCHSLRRQGNYAIDQYPLPLTGKTQSNRQSLHCTTLVNFDGMVLHVDFKSDLSDKEGVAEKMVPKGSMVFLCKQELSTPAMLEHLLAAGIHGAGRVGGARGEIGDEFVSADGKLMLRRSHCGFILSTTGNGQRNVASLIDNFEKAQISACLNKDLQNLYSIHPTGFSISCWPQTVLWYLTDLALVNSWLLYRQDARNVATPLTLLAFRLEVSKALILSSGSDTQDSLPNRPQTANAHTTSEIPNPRPLDENPLPDAATRYDGSGHWPEQLSEGEGGRCRFGDCQRTSRVLCLKCCVFLCISRNHNCFLNFHSQGHQGKE